MPMSPTSKLLKLKPSISFNDKCTIWGILSVIQAYTRTLPRPKLCRIDHPQEHWRCESIYGALWLLLEICPRLCHPTPHQATGQAAREEPCLQLDGGRVPGIPGAEKEADHGPHPGLPWPVKDPYSGQSRLWCPHRHVWGEGNTYGIWTLTKAERQ